MVMNNISVNQLAESIVASGYPKRINTDDFKLEVKLFQGWLNTFDKTPNEILERAIEEHPTEDSFQKAYAHYDRARKLGITKQGQGHDNFANGIMVSFDLTFSNKAWVEAERYHFLDFVSSQSTMHRISKMDINGCCNEYVDFRIIQTIDELQAEYNKNPTKENYLSLLYNIPSGFQLTARMITNYRQLKTIYYQRRNHRLPEWREFCEEIEELPLFRKIMLMEEDI